LKKKLPILFLLLSCAATTVYAQYYSARDLLTVSNLPSNGLANYMFKNGFLQDHNFKNDTIQERFIPVVKNKKKHAPTLKNLEFYENSRSRCFIYHTDLLEEYTDGVKRLLKSGFIYDQKKDLAKDSSILFQKKNLSVQATITLKDTIPEYSFLLRQRKIPDSIVYAEDLLQFDSNEFLVSYFGQENTTKDLYYFSEKDLKKCTVLFNGTLLQVAFIWGDQNNLDQLAYIIISNVLPTKDGKEKSIVNENNSWKFESGIHHGMTLKELLRLNEADFRIYGIKSELAFMAEPENTGKIDFKKTGFMFTCRDCSDNSIFEQKEVSALDIVKAKLPMQVFDIIVYP